MSFGKISYMYLEEINLGVEEWDYGYDIIGIWADNDGGLYLGTDSGCSYPTPWENHQDSALTGPLTFDQMAEEATNLWGFGRADRREPYEFVEHKFADIAKRIPDFKGSE